MVSDFAESFMVSVVLTRHSILDVAAVDLRNCQNILAKPAGLVEVGFSIRFQTFPNLRDSDSPLRSLFRVASRSDSASPAQ